MNAIQLIWICEKCEVSMISNNYWSIALFKSEHICKDNTPNWIKTIVSKEDLINLYKSKNTKRG